MDVGHTGQFVLTAGSNGIRLAWCSHIFFDELLVGGITGFISFENSGRLLVSPVAHEDSLKKMGIITDRVVNVGGFAEPQREFLDFHRSKVFLKREAD